MLGKSQRFQNGFDCQGLWVEVEVEKELGLKSKRDIEQFGVAEFVERCKERVLRFAKRQTDQSIRLGYWMDWDDSYFTMSDENNYTIWHFLKTCHERGWIYKGHDVMPWCPRCGTGISSTRSSPRATRTGPTSPSTRCSRSTTSPTQASWSGRRHLGRCPANVAAAVHPRPRLRAGPP
jgi:isoleucyl-tRNA synthetase